MPDSNDTDLAPTWRGADVIDGAWGIRLGDEGVAAGGLALAEAGAAQVGVLRHAALQLPICQHPAPPPPWCCWCFQNMIFQAIGFSNWVFQMGFPTRFSKWVFQLGFPNGFSNWVF